MKKTLMISLMLLSTVSYGKMLSCVEVYEDAAKHPAQYTTGIKGSVMSTHGLIPATTGWAMVTTVYPQVGVPMIAGNAIFSTGLTTLKVQEREQKERTKALQLIKEKEIGDGPMMQKLLISLKEEGHDFSTSQLSDLLSSTEIEAKLCNLEPMKYSDIVDYVVSKLSSYEMDPR